MNAKQQLLEYIARIHPAQEFSPLDLEPGGAHALPGGFAITSNPFAVSTQVDPNRLTLFGPLDTAVAVPTLEMFGGRVVIRGIALLQAIARLVETGPPTWSRRAADLSEWWKKEISGCAPFEVPDPAPKNRQEMESHIESCTLCQPVSMAMAASISAGSSAYRDSDIADMVDRAHSDQGSAIQFYEQKTASLSRVLPSNPVKTRTRKVAEVPA